MVEFRNVGMRTGTVNISWDKSLPLKITPESFDLEAPKRQQAYDDEFDEDELEDDSTFVVQRKTTQQVKVEYSGTELGVFRALAKIEVNLCEQTIR